VNFARSLVLDYVIRQHERVAMSKLPDDTFRFRRDGDRLRFSTLRAEAGFNDSRFTAVSTIVAELGLAGGLQSADHALTTTGARLLTTGDLAPAAADPSRRPGRAGMTRLRVPDSLRGGEWEHALVLSYSLDLSFYERDLGRTLARVPNRVVLADARRLAEHFDDIARGGEGRGGHRLPARWRCGLGQRVRSSDVLVTTRTWGHPLAHLPRKAQ